jgi:hypothetical protein
MTTLLHARVAMEVVMLCASDIVDASKWKSLMKERAFMRERGACKLRSVGRTGPSCFA